MNEAQRRELRAAQAWAQDMLAKRSGLKRVPLVIGIEELDSITVQDLVEWAEGVRAQVPPEHWSDSRLEIEDGFLSGYYARPETPEERDADAHYQKLKSIGGEN